MEKRCAAKRGVEAIRAEVDYPVVVALIPGSVSFQISNIILAMFLIGPEFYKRVEIVRDSLGLGKIMALERRGSSFNRAGPFEVRIVRTICQARKGAFRAIPR